jgi:hypothetical protein
VTTPVLLSSKSLSNGNVSDSGGGDGASDGGGAGGRSVSEEAATAVENGVSLYGMSFRSRPPSIRVDGVGVASQRASLDEISVYIPDPDVDREEEEVRMHTAAEEEVAGGSESRRAGGWGGVETGVGEGESGATAAPGLDITNGGSDTKAAARGDGDGKTGAIAAAEAKVNLYGISIRSDPESVERARRVRMAHRDFEVTGAAAGAARTDAAGKEFLIAVRIKAGARNFIRKTADDAGLRALPGLFLVSIERPRTAATLAATTPSTAAAAAATAARVLSIVGAASSSRAVVSQVDIVDPGDDPLEAGDVLWYAGNANSIAMIRKVPGLAPYSSDQVDKLNGNNQERRLVQAVVAKTGPLVGKSIRDTKFRSRYNAVVLAVHREGVRVHARIGDVVLLPGDVLLLDAGPDFHREAGHSGSGFALVSVLEDSAPPRLRLLVPVILIAIAMITLFTAGVMNLLIAAIFAAAIMMACGALSEQEARNAVKWDVIVTIAAAFGMSRALQNSGVAGTVAAKLVQLAELSGTGRAGLLVAVYFATFLISNVVTNNAAAALMFPIAAEAAERQGETLESISFLVMLAASASFMSPFGYQTNLMVYGPGGYVFKDFLRFGFPMQVVQLVVSVAVIVLGSGLWWVSWGFTGIVFALVCVVMTTEMPTPSGVLASLWGALASLRFSRRRNSHSGGDGSE